MDKKFEILNYDELPKKVGFGSHSGKILIDWDKIEKGFIFKTIHSKYGFNEFEFVRRGGKYLYLLFDGEIRRIQSYSFQKGQINFLIGKTNFDFIYSIGDVLKDEKRDIIITEKKYIRDKNGRLRRFYNYSCNKCGWEKGCSEEKNLMEGRGCPVCCRSPQVVVSGINDMATTTPWMVEYLVNKEDAYRYTSQSNKKIKMACLDCGKEKYVRPNKLYKCKTLSCVCKDNYSYPQKFINNMLKQLGVKFETEYSPNYLDKKRSDFYLSSFNLIIEADGSLGHSGGRVYTKSSKTLEECIEIDKWKDEQHKIHGVETIRINCFKSDLEYMKNAILNSKLNELLDLSKIDWTECEAFALKNVVKEICNYWANKEDWETTTTIANNNSWGISSVHTIIRYLKKGAKLGWCDYDPKEETRKGSGNRKNKRERGVVILKDGLIIGEFKSANYIEKNSMEIFGEKMFGSNICKVCKGEKSQYKGLTFKYVENN